VLRRTVGNLGEFRRIGHFACGTSGLTNWFPGREFGVEMLWNDFVDLLHQQGATTAREVCADVINDHEHGTEGFVIKIV
jgi:hypothetical protein